MTFVAEYRSATASMPVGRVASPGSGRAPGAPVASRGQRVECGQRLPAVAAEDDGPAGLVRTANAGADAVSASLSAFPLDGARCATYPVPLDWVPDREGAVVPEVMGVLCRRCPAREACLRWAVSGGELGYWAGTTTADRDRMAGLGVCGVEAADRLQEQARADACAGALHCAGEGSYWWYRRRGCRCGECRTANASVRAEERARSRRRRAVAA